MSCLTVLRVERLHQKLASKLTEHSNSHGRQMVLAGMPTMESTLLNSPTHCVRIWPCWHTQQSLGESFTPEHCSIMGTSSC